jgi:hypothetical protein
VPDVELDAQAAYSRARRELRALLAAVPDGMVCGPCTAFVAKHRAEIATLTRDLDEGKGTHWRQHSAKRNTPRGLAVDLYANACLTVAGETRRLTVRELACIALLNGAELTGDTAEDCVAEESRRVRTDLARNAKPSRNGVPFE